MKKKVLTVVAVVAGVALVALVIVYFMLNGIVRRAVETNATDSLKVQTVVGGASVAPFSGNVSLSDLMIKSPEGFAAPEMFTLGEVSVQVGYSDLFGEPVRVANITITRPKLVLEQAGGKLNVMELVNNLKTDTPAPTEEGEPMRLIVNRITVADAQVEIRPGIPGLAEMVQVNVPAVTLNNIGTAEGNQNGEEIGRIVTEVAEALGKKALESDQIPPELRQVLSFDPDQLRAAVEARVGKEIGNVKDNVQKQVDEQRDKLKGKAEDALGDILGGKK